MRFSALHPLLSARRPQAGDIKGDVPAFRVLLLHRLDQQSGAAGEFARMHHIRLEMSAAQPLHRLPPGEFYLWVTV